jgi:serine/threonine protein kinase
MAKRKQLLFKTDLDTYTSQGLIGEGGSGRVYRASDSSGDAVAIKVLNPRYATDSKVKRFKNELNFGRRIRHDHVVPIIDAGICELDEEQTPFFVMPLYDGSLRSLIKETLKPDRALRLYKHLLDGIAFAHGRGVWHRDIKPENVLFESSNDRLLLGDFGIAHFGEDELHTAVETKDAERLANFQYAAPEQRTRNASVDQRADIYALGLILNEMFTGMVPHGTGYRSVAATDSRHGFVDEIVDRMIRSRPEDRYASIDAVKSDFALLSAGPALSKARQVGTKVSAADEKERLFWSEEGVSRASKQIDTAYDHALALLEQLRLEIPVLKMEFERSDKEIVVRTRRASARINWYQPFSNVMKTARVTIWTYRGRLLLPSHRGRYVSSVEPQEVGENAFRPDYTAERGLCWVDEAGKNLSPTELGDRLVGKFLEVVEAHELSEQEEDPDS